MGGERQTLIDVELKRTEFRLDVLKLRKQLTEIGVRRGAESEQPMAVVTTPAGSVVEPAGQASAAASVATEKTAPGPTGSG